MIGTKKRYYDDPDLLMASARVLAVDGNKIITDETIFYPEGGGQVGDIGYLGSYQVVDTQKRGGHTIVRQDLPVINVETQVVHILNTEVANLRVGDVVEASVDAAHRRGVRRHHTAIHLVMGAIWERLGRDSFFTKGCQIRPTEARIDMATSHKFNTLLLELEARVNEWVSTDAPVEMLPFPGVPEVFTWNCGLGEFMTQPCGGLHVSSLGQLRQVRLKREGKGKGLERLYAVVVTDDVMEE